MSGKALRLKRFQTAPNGRMVILPLDHGVSCGPLRGLERPEAVIRMGVQEGADALVLHKGMLRYVENLTGQLPAPEQVGRTESHGCFRLANWDAEYLSKLVWAGMPVLVEPWARWG